MTYDDIAWHDDPTWSCELPDGAAATHSGMFLAWALQRGLGSERHAEEDPEAVAALESRRITPGRFLLRNCDGRLTDDDLNDEGNAFAVDYFDLETGHYTRDYEATLLSDVPNRYLVPDTWDSFDRLSPVLDRRLQQWRAQRG